MSDSDDEDALIIGCDSNELGDNFSEEETLEALAAPINKSVAHGGFIKRCVEAVKEQNAGSKNCGENQDKNAPNNDERNQGGESSWAALPNKVTTNENRVSSSNGLNSKRRRWDSTFHHFPLNNQQPNLFPAPSPSLLGPGPYFTNDSYFLQQTGFQNWNMSMPVVANPSRYISNLNDSLQKTPELRIYMMSQQELETNAASDWLTLLNIQQIISKQRSCPTASIYVNRNILHSNYELQVFAGTTSCEPLLFSDQCNQRNYQNFYPSEQWNEKSNMLFQNDGTGAYSFAADSSPFAPPIQNLSSQTRHTNPSISFPWNIGGGANFFKSSELSNPMPVPLMSIPQYKFNFDASYLQSQSNNLAPCNRNGSSKTANNSSTVSKITPFRNMQSSKGNTSLSSDVSNNSAIEKQLADQTLLNESVGTDAAEMGELVLNAPPPPMIGELPSTSRRSILERLGDYCGAGTEDSESDDDPWKLTVDEDLHTSNEGLPSTPMPTVVDFEDGPVEEPLNEDGCNQILEEDLDLSDSPIETQTSFSRKPCRFSEESLLNLAKIVQKREKKHSKHLRLIKGSRRLVPEPKLKQSREDHLKKRFPIKARSRPKPSPPEELKDQQSVTPIKNVPARKIKFEKNRLDRKAAAVSEVKSTAQSLKLSGFKKPNEDHPLQNVSSKRKKLDLNPEEENSGSPKESLEESVRDEPNVPNFIKVNLQNSSSKRKKLDFTLEKENSGSPKVSSEETVKVNHKKCSSKHKKLNFALEEENSGSPKVSSEVPMEDKSDEPQPTKAKLKKCSSHRKKLGLAPEEQNSGSPKLSTQESTQNKPDIHQPKKDKLQKVSSKCKKLDLTLEEIFGKSSPKPTLGEVVRQSSDVLLGETFEADEQNQKQSPRKGEPAEGDNYEEIMDYNLDDSLDDVPLSVLWKLKSNMKKKKRCEPLADNNVQLIADENVPLKEEPRTQSPLILLRASNPFGEAKKETPMVIAKCLVPESEVRVYNIPFRTPLIQLLKLCEGIGDPVGIFNRTDTSVSIIFRSSYIAAMFVNYYHEVVFNGNKLIVEKPVVNID